MQIIKRTTLTEYGKRHAPVMDPLMKWYKTVRTLQWTSPTELKRDFPGASLIDGHRVVFNIKGNAYRLLVYVQYKQPWMKQGTVFIKRVMTHAEYDKLDMNDIHYEG